MRVTIGQINTTNGDYEGNTAGIIRAHRARQERRRRIWSSCRKPAFRATPRSIGFSIATWRAAPCNRWKKSSPPPKDSRRSSAPSGPTICPTGRRLYNSAAIIRDRKLLGFADKTLLPEYDVFDDPRYFEPARERHLFTVDGCKLGVAVCEDFWNDKTFWSERLYPHDPADELIELGAEVLISINASPFNKGKMGQRCAMVSHRAKAAKLPIVFVNLVGGNDGIIFDGASIVADCEGKIILQAPPFEEFFGTVDLDCGVADERCLPGDDIETIRSALVLGIRDYARKNRFTKAVLGLSGGIDSAVVAALACEALGAENVLSVMMPSPYSSRSSIDDSVELGRRLGMQVIEHPITNAFEVLLKELNLPPATAGASSHAAENLQSRLRGNILMTISNAEGRLLLSTGNKSELALGYCTLYGDTNGGLAVIGDVLKTEVYALARHLNRESEIIPERELSKSGRRPNWRPDQFDDQSLPPYDELDPILKMYFEQKATPEEIIAAGNDREHGLRYSEPRRVAGQ